MVFYHNNVGNADFVKIRLILSYKYHKESSVDILKVLYLFQYILYIQSSSILQEQIIQKIEGFVMKLRYSF